MSAAAEVYTATPLAGSPTAAISVVAFFAHGEAV
jgi:hypothetical protein